MTSSEKQTILQCNDETINHPSGKKSSLNDLIEYDLCRMQHIHEGYDIDVHIHLPETNVTKDVSIHGAVAAIALISSMTGIPVKKGVVILGELTLAGILWPLEHVNKTEVYTARGGNMKHLILPQENVIQLQNLNEDILKDLSITGASSLLDVLSSFPIWMQKKKQKKTIRSSYGH